MCIRDSNSALQQQHFNENYMQSDKFPFGTFKGKIIETVDLTKNGTYQVRAKGILDIHGVKKERIIPATVVVNGNQLTIRAQFEIPLVDHDIRIPKVVNQKIAEIITVTVTGNLGLN
jgi:polyisoprenoid-binding protein YceI